MKKVSGWLKKYSHDEKERCSFEKYLKDRVHYEERSDNQVNEHYIANKTKYEYKKSFNFMLSYNFLNIIFGDMECVFRHISENSRVID